MASSDQVCTPARVGGLGAGRFDVDHRGRVTTPAGWSLAWAVGAEDRWRVPERQAAEACRQRLVGHAPVIETLTRVPGGEACHRAFVVAGPDGIDEGRVELLNDSPAPVAVVLVVEGAGGQLALGAGGLSVDGSPILGWSHRPGRVAWSPGAGALDAVLAGAALEWRDQSGSEVAAPAAQAAPASVALVWPLAHRSRLSVRLGLPSLRSAETAVPSVTAEAAAAGWTARVEAAMRLDWPAGAGVLEPAVEAQRRYLLLWASPSAGPLVVAALSQAGYRREADAAVEEWLREQAEDGRLGPDPATEAARAWAAADHALRSGDEAEGRSVLVPLVEAGESMARPSGWRRPPADARARAFRVGALDALGALLERAGEPAAAGQVRAWAASQRTQLVAELTAGRDPTATTARLLGATILDLFAGAPVPPSRHSTAGPEAPGLLEVGVAEAALRSWLEGPSRLETVAAGAGPRWAWPEPDETALVWMAGRALFAREHRGWLAVAEGLPRSWLGREYQVHRMPTRLGRLSYALRWHGERPALLWEVTGATGEVALRAPGLDPQWVGRGATGEALLAPVLE